MNFLAMLTALAGSPSVSPMISSIFLPFTPPSPLILSTTMSATSLVGVPMKAAGPDRSKKAPTLIVSAALAMPPPISMTAAATTASLPAFLMAPLLLLILYAIVK